MLKWTTDLIEREKKVLSLQDFISKGLSLSTTISCERPLRVTEVLNMINMGIFFNMLVLGVFSCTSAGCALHCSVTWFYSVITLLI